METQTLDIPVLWPNYFEDCELCIERLKEALRELDGMHSVTLNSDGRTIEVVYDREVLTFEEIKERAHIVGVTIEEKYKHESIQIAGLDCPDCAMKVETGVRRIDGVVWDSLNYATSILTVEYEPSKTSLDEIYKRIRGFGYDIEEKEPTAPEVKKVSTIRSARLTLTVTSGFLLAVGLIINSLIGNQYNIAAILFIASAICGGIFSARSGLLSLKSYTMDTNFLMTVAAVGAVWLRQYFEAASVMFLFSLGSTLESYTVDKTRRSIKSLIEAFPTHASVKRNGHIAQVKLDEIEIGEIVLIKPGDKVPVDGTITAGDSTINEAPITGESVPKNKHKGDPVYAGSINGHGSLEVRTTSSADDNTIARIVDMVEEAQTHKAPSQRFSETFGKYYTPVVIFLAVLTAIFGPVIFGGGFNAWLHKSLTLLVVSCPCALVISTPVAIVAAIGNAARSGILIKGGAHLETLGDVSIVAFDKTGTLTTGKLAVVDVITFNGSSADDVLATAAAIESRSEHPLADAIFAKARELELEDKTVSYFEAYPGRGASAVVDAELYFIGSKRFLEEHSIKVPSTEKAEALLNRGATVVYISNEKEIIGAIGAIDTLKDNSIETISRLKSVGIKSTVMLTGDTAKTGSAIARELGLDEHYADLLPEDKLKKIHEFVNRRAAVAMVGDGINDAPALAAANVGIAMGGMGSHTAVEAADIALMGDDIVMLPYAVTLSRKAKRIIKQNISFAILVVIILVSGALFSKINLASGVLGHEGSALLVIANSMRLLKSNKPM